MKYTVLQIPFPRTKHEEDIYCRYAYKPLNMVGSINLDYYEKIYEGNLETSNNDVIKILDEIFTILNVNHPEDYKGHSLSVSDIILIGENYYYCDSFGWREVQFY